MSNDDDDNDDAMSHKLVFSVVIRKLRDEVAYFTRSVDNKNRLRYGQIISYEFIKGSLPCLFRPITAML